MNSFGFGAEFPVCFGGADCRTDPPTPPGPEVPEPVVRIESASSTQAIVSSNNAKAK